MSVQQVPYLVSIFLAACAWGITHTVDRIVSSPTVEYHTRPVESFSEGNRRIFRMTVMLHNLSLSTSFHNARFAVRKAQLHDDLSFLGSDHQKYEPKMVIHPPMWPGRLDDTSCGTEGQLVQCVAKEPVADHRSVEFTVPNLPPDGKVDLIVYFEGTARPVFAGAVDAASATAMRLSPRTIGTFITRYEFSVIFVILSVATVGVVWLFSTSRILSSIVTMVVILLLILFSSDLFAREVKSPNVEVKVLQVRVKGQPDEGVRSKIYKLDESEKHQLFINTDRYGNAEPRKQCSKTHRLMAVPESSMFIPGRDFPSCSEKVTIYVNWTPVAALMRDPENWGSQAGNYSNQRYSQLDQINKHTSRI